MFHKGIQGNLEGESSSLSEVTSKGFFPGTPSIIIIIDCCLIQRTGGEGGRRGRCIMILLVTRCHGNQRQVNLKGAGYM